MYLRARSPRLRCSSMISSSILRCSYSSRRFSYAISQPSGDFKTEFQTWGNDRHLQIFVAVLFGKIKRFFVGGVGLDFDDVIGESLEHGVPAL